MDFVLKFVDVNLDVCEEFEKQFSHYENIEVYNDYFESVTEYDCIVSPANSFGIMDGGIDAAIIRYFGKQLETDVQQYIITNFSGEQPVGTSFIIPTHHEVHPFLAHTPTMRVPQNIEGSLNVYYAMKAMLSAVAKHNRVNEQQIRTVLCPGMGTFVGEMQPKKAVEQMVLAYEHFVNPPIEINVPYVYNRLSQIRALIINN